jgi:hypothetical protein
MFRFLIEQIAHISRLQSRPITERASHPHAPTLSEIASNAKFVVNNTIAKR